MWALRTLCLGRGTSPMGDAPPLQAGRENVRKCPLLSAQKKMLGGRRPQSTEARMTRAEIVAEVTAMRLTPRQAAAMIALTEFQFGLSLDQVCPDCGRAVEV